ncbi:MAG: CsgG/HfaB family protein, partial [Armatimonadota bacterium]
MIYRFSTRKLIMSLALLTALAATPSIAKEDKGNDAKPAAKPAYTGPKQRIAVMPMTAEGKAEDLFGQWANIYKSENRAYTSEDVGRKLTEMLTTALFDTGRFVILERQNVGDIRDEIAIGAELGNEKTAVKKGNVLGAQILVRAAVTEFENSASGQSGGVSFKGFKIGGNKGKAKVVIDVRMYDSTTSQILYNAKADGDSTSQGGAIA